MYSVQTKKELVCRHIMWLSVQKLHTFDKIVTGL